ncbi:hypothetical protein GGR21_001633 [Dysgonomonas hofstadii]|uniref:Uncharacterized protein n=1 Tax=Dysgonomonas hofstadii TaxID=637886 RepID=A0A840CNS7_9BACT|nr:hypothetical protein [Dysgonomonas hofstadii]
MINFVGALVRLRHPVVVVKGNQVKILNRPRCCKHQ